MFRRDLLAGGAALGLLPALRTANAQNAPAPAAEGGVVRTHALSLLGQPALPAGFPHWPWVNPDAPKGGEIVRTALGAFDSFNPFILRGTAAAGIGQIWETLLADSADEASTAYGHLVREIELPADRLGVTFTLRDEARWHDGQPITADDVVWSFDALRQHGRPNYRSYYADVSEVRADGPQRVVFRFKNNENRELAQVLGQLPVLPKHWWATRDFTKPTLEIPLGSGPYRLDRFEPNRTLVFRRVPDYWARNLNTRRGTNNWDTVRYEYFRDNTVALEAFKAGSIDIRQENVAKDWATAYDFPAARQGLVKRDEIRNEIPTGMQCFALNHRRDLFKDPRVREALGLAFDFEWLNKNIFYNSYTRTSSYFSNSELACSGTPQGTELAILEKYRGRVPDRLFTEEFKLPATDGSGNNRDNLRRALALLKEAGWDVKDRQLRNAAGQPFRFEILLGEPVFERVALPYVQSLQRLGVDASVRTVDLAQYQKRMEQFDYDITVDLYGESLSPGNEQRDYWTSRAATDPGSANTMGVADPVVDELVELVIAAPDREALIARTHALDRVLLWGQHCIPHWHLQSFRIAYWDKFGRPPRNPRYALALDSWWIESARTGAVEEGRRQQQQQQPASARP